MKNFLPKAIRKATAVFLLLNIQHFYFFFPDNAKLAEVLSVEIFSFGKYIYFTFMHTGFSTSERA